MAVTNTLSDLATKQAAAKLDPSAGVINGDDATGLVLIATAKVTIPASVEATSTLVLVPAELLPVGAVVIPQLSHVYLSTDPGTSITMDVGLVSDPNKFCAGLVLTTAGTTGGAVCLAASGSTPDGLTTPYRITTQENLIATISAVDTPVAGTNVVIFTIAYRTKG